MTDTVLKNLYSPSIVFDEVIPLKQMKDTFNYNLVNNIYIYKDNKKPMIQENESNNDFVNNYVNSFIIDSRKGDY